MFLLYRFHNLVRILLLITMFHYTKIWYSRITAKKKKKSSSSLPQPARVLCYHTWLFPTDCGTLCPTCIGSCTLANIHLPDDHLASPNLSLLALTSWFFSFSLQYCGPNLVHLWWNSCEHLYKFLRLLCKMSLHKIKSKKPV